MQVVPNTVFVMLLSPVVSPVSAVVPPVVTPVLPVIPMLFPAFMTILFGELRSPLALVRSRRHDAWAKDRRR